MKDSYVFYRSFYKALKKVKDKELRADLYDAICELGLNENVMELDSEVGQIIMELIEPQLTANQKRYEIASKSGRPKTINDQEIERLILEGESNKEIVKKSKCSLTTVKNIRQKLAKNWSESQKPNVNDNDNVNVNDNDYISPTPTNNNKSGETIFDVVQREFGRVLSPIELEITEGWLAKNYSEELILYAVKEAILNNAKSLKYVQRILERLESQGIKTVSEAQRTSFHQFVSEAQNKKEVKELFDYDWLNDDEGEENEI